MTQLEIYREDGSVSVGTTYDREMVSRAESCRAVETWQVGMVKGALAVRLKTVASLNALLRRAADGDHLEIIYRPTFSAGELKEMRIVCRFGKGILPVLMPLEQPALTDSEIVQRLALSQGDLITVTYKLLSLDEAALNGPDPLKELSVAEKILVGGTRGIRRAPRERELVEAACF